MPPTAQGGGSMPWFCVNWTQGTKDLKAAIPSQGKLASQAGVGEWRRWRVARIHQSRSPSSDGSTINRPQLHKSRQSPTGTRTSIHRDPSRQAWLVDLVGKHWSLGKLVKISFAIRNHGPFADQPLLWRWFCGGNTCCVAEIKIEEKTHFNIKLTYIRYTWSVKMEGGLVTNSVFASG